jgi:hypothetical protein
MFQIMCPASGFSSPVEKVERAMRSVTVDREARENQGTMWAADAVKFV